MKDSKLEKILLTGKYCEAKEYVNDMCWEDVETSICLYGFDDGNFLSYSFAKYMYDETKDKRWRELLFYFDVCPDAEGLIEKSEKINVARELLSLVPGHEDAMAYLNECEHDGFDNAKEKDEIAKDISALEDLLDKAHYEAVEKVIRGMDLQEVRDILVNLTAEILSVEACGFAHYMIKKTNAEEWFRIQFDILTVGLRKFRKYGVNSVALYYVRELVNISRTAENLELFLKLYHEPDHVVDRKEAEQVAKEILSMEPDNQVAKEVMQSTTFMRLE